MTGQDAERIAAVYQEEGTLGRYARKGITATFISGSGDIPRDSRPSQEVMVTRGPPRLV